MYTKTTLNIFDWMKKNIYSSTHNNAALPIATANGVRFGKRTCHHSGRMAVMNHASTMVSGSLYLDSPKKTLNRLANDSRFRTEKNIKVSAISKRRMQIAGDT